MCGYFGSTNGRSLGRQALSHRGPDGYGLFRDGDVVLEHWRLSIIDLSANGAQPMAMRHSQSPVQTGAHSDLVIAYNGEVYNFQDLRRETHGHDYVSSTDTEVVLRLYAEQGLACLPKLNGMFSFAIYDQARQQLVLARDRFGIKPLYYCVDDQSNLSFASELRALLRGSPVDLTLDRRAIQSLFHLLYIEGERTPFERVHKLAPGSYLVFDLKTKAVTIGRYHDFRFSTHGSTEEQSIDRIEDLLDRSVQMHLISDVPVGALLSGGVDSSLLVALMAKHTDEIHTFSVGYEDNPLFDESRYFNLVAARYHTDHHHTVIRQDGLDKLVREVCGLLDEPIGDTSVFLNYFIFGFAAQSVKVCLSGLGGDELFGGYNRHLAFKFLPSYMAAPPTLRRGLRSIFSHLPSSRHGRVGNKIRLVKTFLAQTDPDLGRTYCNFLDYFAHCGASPVPSAGTFTNSRFDAYWDEALTEEFNRVYKYDLTSYMVNDLLFLTDRMSMRHSIEARVPYLENDLVDYSLGIAPRAKIRGRTLKYLLKKVAERHLPREVIYRRKQGFSSPISGLLSPHGLDSLLATLSSSKEEYVEILDRSLFRRLIEAHRTGTEDHSLNLFTLMIYLAWMPSVLGTGTLAPGTPAR